MNHGLEKAVQETAYYIWKERECPEGQDLEIWYQAVSIVLNKTARTISMPDLSVKVVHDASIDELIYRVPQFSFLKNIKFPQDDSIEWTRNGKNVYCVQVMFIGKTGYGKSTTLNRICGQKIFEISDISSCTKELYSSEYKLANSSVNYFSLCDLPGLGESLDTDKEYSRLYSEMVVKSACVIYVFRADQRDFSEDEKILGSLLKQDRIFKGKLIAGINYADKVEPVTRANPFEPNYQQQKNLKEKAEDISRIFGISLDKIVCYSASDGYNFKELLEKISTIIKKTC